VFFSVEVRQQHSLQV